MRVWLCVLLAAGLLAGCHAGSGKDIWGETTLTNYPPGRSRLEVPVQANDDGMQTPIALKCQCSDADPRGQDTQEVTYNCFHQRLFQKCSETYMFDANAELAPEGFCQISCSRCNCCEPPTDVLKTLGANRFLQALEATQPSLKDLLSHPGYTANLLVPTDDAFDAALAKYGTLLQNPAFLTELLKFHIVPPEPVRRGLWSSPLMSVGPKLYTLYDGPETLSVPRFTLPSNVTWEGGLAGFKIQGPYNAATVVKSDVTACKSLITLIDSVLLPFDPTAAPAPDYLAVSRLVGARGCGVQPNALITGTELQAGDANRHGTIGGCCASCAAFRGCNAWRYCSQKGGCRLPEGQVIKYGACTLLRSSELAAGSPPNYADFSATTVPLASGWVLTGPEAAAAQQAASTAAQPAGAFAAQPASEAEPRVSAQGAGRRLFQV
ncbi:hypothetical protein COHA_001863 [Chlorella ohadii]|uniref:FAS1 domain-containing protein n=1 Tax=Chlorella ohadii TaxID=2649997 RepID=A0AAD5H517_9CHLO|nr:hypothetical protein COHA_001863 [Chlorella ohadii]